MGATSSSCRAVPAGHSSLNAAAVTLTALLKFTVIVAVARTFVAPFVGVVVVTVGGASTVIVTVAMLESACPSFALKVKLSGPVYAAFGV